MAGQVVHVEIPADGTAKAREFWGGLFGWRWQAVQGPFEYPHDTDQRADRRGDPQHPNMEPGKRGPRVYFDVDDINAGAARVTAAACSGGAAGLGCAHLVADCLQNLVGGQVVEVGEGVDGLVGAEAFGQHRGRRCGGRRDPAGWVGGCRPAPASHGPAAHGRGLASLTDLEVTPVGRNPSDRPYPGPAASPKPDLSLISNINSLWCSRQEWYILPRIRAHTVAGLAAVPPPAEFSGRDRAYLAPRSPHRCRASPGLSPEDRGSAGRRAHESQSSTEAAAFRQIRDGVEFMGIDQAYRETRHRAAGTPPGNEPGNYSICANHP